MEVLQAPVDFSLLASGGISGLQPYQPGKPIEELERELGIRNIIKLASNENPLGPSGKVLQAVEKKLGSISRYPDPFAFVQYLAGHLDVRETQITLGNGSNQVLNLVAQCFLSSSGNAVISEHAFIVYPLAVQAIGAHAKTVAAKNYGHDLQAMLDAIDKNTRLVFIANPNNPTGTWNSSAEVKNFLQRVPADVIVVLDEAYAEYVVDKNYASGLGYLSDFPNLIVTRTFSKAYGLAGLRIGYSVSSPQIANLLNRVREPFNVNQLALVAAQAALEDQEYLQKSVQLNSSGMRELEQGFQQLGLRYIPSMGNFLALEFEQDVSQLYQLLLHEGVIVRPVGIYNLPRHLRVTVGLPEENRRFLHVLEDVLKKVSG
jgi:histidinol-phosphate aminotransferase